MYCIKCGKQIQDDSKFCEFCGASQLDITEDIKAAENAANQELAEAEAVIAEAQAKTDDIQTFLENEKAPEAPDYGAPYRENQAQTSYQPDQQASTTSYQPSYQQPQGQQQGNYTPGQGNFTPGQSTYAPGQSTYAPGQGYYQPVKKKKTWPIIVIAAIIIVLLAGVIIPNLGGGHLKAMNSPEDVFDNYFTCVKKKDLDGIVSLMPKVWYEFLRERYPDEEEFWTECDYFYEWDQLGYEVTDYEYEVYEDYTQTEINNINSNIPGLNATKITTYSVYVYYKNGDSEMVYIDTAVIDGDYYFIECW